MLSEGHIAPPIRDVLRHQRNTRVVLGEVVDVDVDERELTINTLGRETKLAYDSLIVATGASQSYFGHDEYARHALGLKTIDDALELRGRIFGAFEIAELEPDPAVREPWLTFAIVGAGPTGVELAGQIAELSRRALRHNFRSFDPTQARIVLLDGLDIALASYPSGCVDVPSAIWSVSASSCASVPGDALVLRRRRGAIDLTATHAPRPEADVRDGYRGGQRTRRPRPAKEVSDLMCWHEQTASCLQQPNEVSIERRVSN